MSSLSLLYIFVACLVELFVFVFYTLMTKCMKLQVMILNNDTSSLEH